MAHAMAHATQYYRATRVPHRHCAAMGPWALEPRFLELTRARSRLAGWVGLGQRSWLVSPRELAGPPFWHQPSMPGWRGTVALRCGQP